MLLKLASLIHLSLTLKKMVWISVLLASESLRSVINQVSENTTEYTQKHWFSESNVLGRAGSYDVEKNLVLFIFKLLDRAYVYIPRYKRDSAIQGMSISKALSVPTVILDFGGR